MKRLVLATLATCLVPTLAVADPSTPRMLALLEDHAEEPPVEATVAPTGPFAEDALRLDMGVGSPIGSLGLVYSHGLSDLAAVEVGAGIGFSGVMLSAMGKLRAGSEHIKFTPGAGLSVGLPLLGNSTVHSGHPSGDDEVRGDPVTMAWLDADLLGVEVRSGSGFTFAASAGLTMALTRGHWDFADLGNDIARGDMFPQARLGLGHTF